MQHDVLTVDTAFKSDARTLLGLVVATLIGAIATAAGVGGGAIYIPLFNVLIGFALKPSTALSQACITAGSLAAVATNLQRTHPAVPDAPLIDFPLMLLLTPLLLVAVGIGVVLNVMLPSWLLNILLLVLLLLLLTQAVAKGRALWAQETVRTQAVAEAAAAGHDDEAEAAVDGGGGDDVSSVSRVGLLVGTVPPSSTHAVHYAASAPAGLRYRRAPSHSGGARGPLGPLALDPDQEASLAVMEGVGDNAGAVPVPMYGAGADATPTRAVPALPLSAFAAATPIRLPSWTGDEGVAAVAEAGGNAAGTGPGTWRSGTGGARGNGGDARGEAGGDGGSWSPGEITPVSSPHYAPSWRAFNELGALDFETDLDGRQDGNLGRDGDGAGGGGGSSASSPALPPSARLLAQLMRRPLPPQLQLSPAAPGRVSGGVLRRRAPLARRTSFDQSLGSYVEVAAAGPDPQGPSGAAGAGDSWLQRRSKWRSRFPPGALPHRVSRTPLLPPDAAPSPGLSSPFGAASRGGTSRFGHRSGSLRPGDGGYVDGGGDGAAGLAQPLLVGPEADGVNRAAAAASLDPTSKYGSSSGAPSTATAAAADTGGDGGAYRPPPTRLATLHEEAADDKAKHGSSPERAGSRGYGLPSAAARALRSASGLLSGLGALEPADAGAQPPPGSRPRSRPASGAWAPAESPRPYGILPEGPLAAGALSLADGGICDSITTAGGAAAFASASATASTRPAAYLEIEVAPPNASAGLRRRGDGGSGDWRRPARRTGSAVVAAARSWAARWAAASHRIPRRFAGGLVATWALYLALQAGRAFQPHCSGAWWGLFAMQTAAMLAISAWALVAAAAALATHAEAVAEAAAAATSSDGGQLCADTHGGALGAGEDGGVRVNVVPSVHVGLTAVEPALGGTAALLVLQAPLATLAATFVAGLTGGLLGLGGGMVMGPLLLQIGVQPQVSAASSGAMVLFSSSAALAQFAMLGRLNGPYAAVFGAVSLVAGLAGTRAVAGAIRRSGRPSLVVLALAGVMALGTVCVTAFGLRQAAAQLRSGELGFVGICSSVGGK